MKKVIVVGGGFAGLNAAKHLAGKPGFQVRLIDRRNHHLFQPLLYQVAMAGLSPADIATPIRSFFSPFKNIQVLLGEVKNVNLKDKIVHANIGDFDYDYLILACGARHSYFGHEDWETLAPGLKTLSQATEIRKRVLLAFEKAESEPDPEKRKKHLTFVVVGGGPTGVELAGAIGEISHYTLNSDFRNIKAESAQILLVQGAYRILPSFSPELSAKAQKALEKLGVQVRTGCRVSHIHENGVEIGEEGISASTVLWAAGVQPSPLNKALGLEIDRAGRIVVEQDLSLPGHKDVFALGDQAHFKVKEDQALPGLAPVAIQQGHYIGKMLIAESKGKPRKNFKYLDKGQMATIGRKVAVMEYGNIKSAGFFAWLSWLLVHIYYLIGFRNRIFVLIQWSWHYFSFSRGARLIVSKEWKFHKDIENEG